MRLAPKHLRAATALARGDPLAALQSIGSPTGSHDAALWGIALAQLEEFADARTWLDRAAAGFARAGEKSARARALAAAAEVAAAQRDLPAADRLLARAARGLEDAGEPRNAAWLLAVHARLCVLGDDLERATGLLQRARTLLPRLTDANLHAALALTGAELATRHLRVPDAENALNHLLAEFGTELHAGLRNEAKSLRAALRSVVAEARRGAATRPLDAHDLASLFRGDPRPSPLRARRWLVVDSIARRTFWSGSPAIDLRRRPVLFELLVALERRWPRPADWRFLARHVFGFAAPDDSVRLRCKVEIDRLRRLLPAPARIVACGNAWRLSLPSAAKPVTVELSHRPGAAADSSGTLVEALLADGARWSLAALSATAHQSRATVLRTLRPLVAGGRVTAHGRGRARRYLARTAAGIASQMLLVGLFTRERRCAP